MTTELSLRTSAVSGGGSRKILTKYIVGYPDVIAQESASKYFYSCATSSDGTLVVRKYNRGKKGILKTFKTQYYPDTKKYNYSVGKARDSASRAYFSVFEDKRVPRGPSTKKSRKKTSKKKKKKN
jgi:hypothetical protein